MTEDVLAVSISPQGKHIAVALLDCNVKVISNSLPHRHTQYVYFYMFLCNWNLELYYLTYTFRIFIVGDLVLNQCTRTPTLFHEIIYIIKILLTCQQETCIGHWVVYSLVSSCVTNSCGLYYAQFASSKIKCT